MCERRYDELAGCIRTLDWTVSRIDAVCRTHEQAVGQAFSTISSHWISTSNMVLDHRTLLQPMVSAVDRMSCHIADTRVSDRLRDLENFAALTTESILVLESGLCTSAHRLSGLEASHGKISRMADGLAAVATHYSDAPAAFQPWWNRKLEHRGAVEG